MDMDGRLNFDEFVRFTKIQSADIPDQEREIKGAVLSRTRHTHTLALKLTYMFAHVCLCVCASAVLNVIHDALVLCLSLYARMCLRAFAAFGVFDTTDKSGL